MRNVGVPTGMLETVVNEKHVARGPGSNATTPASQSNSSSPPPLIRSNTLNANQRLRGLLSGRSASFTQPTTPNNVDKEKALPQPVLTESPPPVPSSTDKPQSPKPSPSQLSLKASSIYGGANLSQDALSNDSSQVSLSMSVAGGTAGFKQVQIPSSPKPDGTPAPATNNPK